MGVMVNKAQYALQNSVTDGEHTALRLAQKGKSTAKIAVCLFNAKGTAQRGLSEAIYKLGAANRVDAARIATHRLGSKLLRKDSLLVYV